jgi:hypothetical protein
VKRPPANLAEAIERLRESNDSLKRHLEEAEQRKTLPPSPWQTSVEALHLPAKVRR